LFSALRGLAKTARYVQLPLESHGYASRESVLHVAWESQRWLDLYVKGSEGVSE
jgi:dipeptidyl aminopeptidase/acylaminoacyl peptidase